MKITLKQPLCISRLNHKNSSTSTKKEKENQHIDFNELKLSDLSTQNNYSKQLTISREFFQNSQRKYFKNKENQMNFGTLPIKVKSSSRAEERIQQLETQNKELKLQNAEMKKKMMEEEGEKAMLKDKIDQFEQNLLALQTEFEEQFKKVPTSEKNIQQKTIIIKQKSGQMKRQPSKQSLEGRRMSLQESVFDLTTKVKEYKNQLEVEKIKRANLERELQISRENARIEMKMEMECMNKKVQRMRQLLQRKDKEIKEKENLIRSFIH